jgi:hypothetical protein
MATTPVEVKKTPPAPANAPDARCRAGASLERIPIMLQHALHERRIWRHFGGQPSHELTDAAAKRIPETESTAKTPPFRTPWESRFNPNGNRSNDSISRGLSSAVDITENDVAYRVTAELPDMSESEIEVVFPATR